MRIRFQADADLRQVLVAAVRRREPAIDFQTANEARLAGLEDPAVLSLSARERRILVTHDWKTMPGHFARFIASGTSPGVLIAPQSLSLGETVEELLLIWALTEPKEWADRICRLPL